MDCLNEIKNKMKQIEEIAKNLGYELGYYEIEDMGNPHHKPPSGSKLKNGYSAVYIFIYKDEFLKIGKANSKSITRFTSQHYGLNNKSTLAKSLLNDENFNFLIINNIKGINKDNMKSWICNNLQRINIYLEPDKAKTELIEAILHYTFRPRFEGNIH